MCVQYEAWIMLEVMLTSPSQQCGQKSAGLLLRYTIWSDNRCTLHHTRISLDKVHGRKDHGIEYFSDRLRCPFASIEGAGYTVAKRVSNSSFLDFEELSSVFLKTFICFRCPDPTKKETERNIVTGAGT